MSGFCLPWMHRSSVQMRVARACRSAVASRNSQITTLGIHKSQQAMHVMYLSANMHDANILKAR